MPLKMPLVARGRQSEIVPLHDYIAQADQDWTDISRRPSEPNPFAEPWFTTASARLAEARNVRMLVIREEGQTIGLMPIVTMPKYGRTRVRHVENWLHFNSFFGAPLIRRSFEPFFWARALQMLDTDPNAPNFLHLVALDGEGPIVRALLAARRGTAIVHRSRRALLASDLSPHAYYEATVRKKKRKEIGRLLSRLKELGEVRHSRLARADQLDDWTAAFLTLEASGWKGRDGAALANDAATATMMHVALRGAFAAGRLEMLRIDLDGRPIAMLVNFLSPPGSFSFKIAFDEEFARFSPGVLIQLENLAILDHPDVAWMDSCAVEGHPMIESLWGERREIVRVTVPLKGWRRRAAFSTARMLENASARVRGWR